MSHNDKSQLSSPFSFLRDGKWWQTALEDAWLFLPYCIFPAILLALANISILISLDNLSDMSSVLAQSLETLTEKLVISGITSLLGMTLTMWALTAWLNRLMAFCRYRLLGLAASKEERKRTVQKVLADISQNQKKLFKFWFLFSLYLLIPIVPLTVLLLAQTIAYSPTLQELNLFTPPAYVNFILLGGIAIFMAVSAAMTAAGIATASKLDLPYRDAASKSVKLFWKHWLMLSVISAAVLLANTVISAPQLITLSGQINSKPDLVPGTIAQIWLAITSSILWTLSLCPPLELLRRDLVSTR